MQRFTSFIALPIALPIALVAALVATFADALLSPCEAAESPAPFVVETAGEGRSIYLVPGLSSPGWVWDDLAERLHGQGYRTHVLTLAGFAGVPPLDLDEPYMPRIRDALAAELADGHAQRPIVIGHSLGGFLAFWLAATESDHLAGAIAVDGVPFYSALADGDTSSESQRQAAEQVATFMSGLTQEQFEQQNRMSLQMMISDPEVRERVGDDSTRSDAATVGRAFAELMTTDLRPMMSEVEVPVLLVQAADSGNVETVRVAYAAQVAPIEDHRHVVAEQGRHFVQLDDPEFLAREVLAFLAAIEEDSNDE